MHSSPRIDARLVAALHGFDNGEHPVADLHRNLGIVAEHLGLAQPSYESVRLLVRDLRKHRAVPGIGGVLLDIALRHKPPDEVSTR